MGREFYYKPGSFYRICDRTGFAIRAERTQMEWNNLIVDRRVFEPRQPQDFVRGVNDDQTVPYARPRTFNAPVNVTATCLFQVYGDNAPIVSFDVFEGQMNVFHATQAITPASFPKSQ